MSIADFAYHDDEMAAHAGDYTVAPSPTVTVELPHVTREEFTASREELLAALNTARRDVASLISIADIAFNALKGRHTKGESK